MVSVLGDLKANGLFCSCRDLPTKLGRCLSKVFRMSMQFRLPLTSLFDDLRLEMLAFRGREVKELVRVLRGRAQRLTIVSVWGPNWKFSAWYWKVVSTGLTGDSFVSSVFLTLCFCVLFGVRGDLLLSR